MFTKIRYWIGNRYFRNEMDRHVRDRSLINLKNARHVGILYELNEPSDYDTVAIFVAALQQDHKEVKALGYVRNRNLESRFLPKLSFDFFSRKDLNWFFMPRHLKVKDFINKNFDLLIDLSLKENLPLKYISGLSVAKCRIGRFDEENKACYDLMIQANGDTSLQDFIKQVTHYLTIINKDEDQK